MPRVHDSRLSTLVLLMRSMIVKGVSDGRFMWRDGEPLTYEEADIYREARGSAGARERGGGRKRRKWRICVEKQKQPEPCNHRK